MKFSMFTEVVVVAAMASAVAVSCTGVEIDKRRTTHLREDGKTPDRVEERLEAEYKTLFTDRKIENLHIERGDTKTTVDLGASGSDLNTRLLEKLADKIPNTNVTPTPAGPVVTPAVPNAAE